MKSYIISNISEIEHSLYGEVISVKIKSDEERKTIFVYLEKGCSIHDSAVDAFHRQQRFIFDESNFTEIDNNLVKCFVYNKLVEEYNKSIMEKGVQIPIDDNNNDKINNNDVGCTPLLIIYAILLSPFIYSFINNWYNKSAIIAKECTSLEEKVEYLNRIKEFKEQPLYKYVLDVPDGINEKEKKILTSINIDELCKINTWNASKDAVEYKDKQLEAYLRKCFEEAQEKNTINAYQSFEEINNSGPFCNANCHEDYKYKTISAIEELKMEDDDTAWDISKEYDHSECYEKYMQKHPNGKHVNEAYINFIRCVKKENPEVLPQLQHNGGKISPYSNLTISNSTEANMKVVLVGPQCTTLSISALSSESIEIASGKYEIVATVDMNGVNRYYGVDRFVGGNVFCKFYITSTR